MGRRAAVAAGGAVGAAARALVAAGLPGPAPLVTLGINLTGAALLGLLLARTRSPVLRAGLGTGVLGAWTTFSTLAVELDGLLREAPAWALALATASAVGGVLAARLGRAAAGDPGIPA